MCCDCECRPLGWLLGLPFAFLASLLLLSCICPCCLCVTVLVELAIELIKAPLHVMQWFTSPNPMLRFHRLLLLYQRDRLLLVFNRHC
ncbi:hypothetical protein J5N97_000909 [Dioscorea zingiberensis]|uniref:Uncharacterized protein n=1 Tax=Dioscorea zingiberensis TaxID=325984 RepID=A0A9D5BUE7_9LILI|nr:hypothetical protein J5N97_000909 [Dioscorea zingiberensis]